MPHDTAERLQKALARLGLASRREAEEWIRAGRLTVNGQPASLGLRVRDTDQIRLDGRLVRRRPTRSEAHVFLYHRSPGDPMRTPVSAEGGDSPGEPDAEMAEPEGSARHHAPAQSDASRTGAQSPWRTPLKDRLPKRAGRRFIMISPMPDVDGGLELISSDGALAEKLQRSVRRLESEFSVRVHGELGDGQMSQIRTGVLDRGTLEVQSLSAGGGESTNRWYTVQTKGASGKDIRQLFERQGAIVSRVLRTRLGPVTLERKLARGQFRKLTEAELESLSTAALGQSQPPDAERSEPRHQRPRRTESSRAPGSNNAHSSRARDSDERSRAPRADKSRPSEPRGSDEQRRVPGYNQPRPSTARGSDEQGRAPGSNKPRFGRARGSDERDRASHAEESSVGEPWRSGERGRTAGSKKPRFSGARSSGERSHAPRFDRQRVSGTPRSDEQGRAPGFNGPRSSGARGSDERGHVSGSDQSRPSRARGSDERSRASGFNGPRSRGGRGSDEHGRAPGSNRSRPGKARGSDERSYAPRADTPRVGEQGRSSGSGAPRGSNDRSRGGPQSRNSRASGPAGGRPGKPARNSGGRGRRS